MESINTTPDATDQDAKAQDAKAQGIKGSHQDINEYIASLIASPRLADQVAHHRLLPALPARHAQTARPLPPAVSALMRAAGIEALYSHQAAAIDAIRQGRHTVTATPTASGKTLIYNLPFFEKLLNRPGARALYLFPLKALAQDQLAGFRRMAEAFTGPPAGAAIYDGDTSAWHRKRIRDNPPPAVLSNPEMLHLSILPYHAQWREMLANLELVVVDEVHTYRGVMGSHMAQVFRRLLRICDHYGARPTFVFSSATVGNPAELAEGLTGLSVTAVTESGAPRGRRHMTLMAPEAGPAQTAILLLKAALHRGLRTIVYTQSRKLAELLALWAGSRSGRFKSRIEAYRAGFLPEQRRQIEGKLASGELLAVISTSALELGIDIGDLDLCLLVGYPGTIVATWQRAGRVGRSGQDSAMVLIGGEDALDQYFIRHPSELLDRPPEDAVINPENPTVLEKHLLCAAAELPLSAGEALIAPAAAAAAVSRLEAGGGLLRAADGNRLYSARKSPHREVSLRGTGGKYDILCADTGRFLGEIDEYRAFRETHPGAIYLHMGETFIVEVLDLDARAVRARPAAVPYYTRARGDKETRILAVHDQRRCAGTRVGWGRLRVTSRVTGYERWRIHGRRKLSVHPLDLPPQVFETEGLWFEIPDRVRAGAEAAFLHFMGGIHAMEHAAIGIFPLLAMSDRNDLGGISTPCHPQLAGAAVFVYDAIPGGAGLSRSAFGRAEALLAATRAAVADCPCETGCPSCVHSPKCGSGNRPIDKAAALYVLDALSDPKGAILNGKPVACAEPFAPSELVAIPDPAAPPEPAGPSGPVPHPAVAVFSARPAYRTFGVLDIETQRSADEVGGWHRADRMGISCVVLYDSAADRCFEYLEKDVPALMEHMARLDLLVGFNIRRFDYKVLSGYVDCDFSRFNTLDLLEEVKTRLGYRLSLDGLAGPTLGSAKTANGLQALKWWREGRIREIIDYCRADVEITRDLFLFGRENGYLLFVNKAGAKVRVPVAF